MVVNHEGDIVRQPRHKGTITQRLPRIQLHSGCPRIQLHSGCPAKIALCVRANLQG